MIRALVGITGSAMAAAGLVAVTPAPASAGCVTVQEEQIINNAIVLIEHEVCGPSQSEPAGDTQGAESLPPPAGSAVCIGGALAIGLDPNEYCGGGEDDEAPAITGGLVANALRRLTLPESELIIQPPGGRTLVNFETNFFTTNDLPFTRTVRLLGRAVELRIWPTSYTWDFDDGSPMTTTSPGARYPDLEITHNYVAKGDYRPRLATTYAAEWRVGDGQWQPVSGTATIEGGPTDLRAIEARPTLVGYGG